MCQYVCFEYKLFTDFIENNSGEEQVTEHHKIYVASLTLTAESEMISLHSLIYTRNLHSNIEN